jgi:hypothetical protein
MAWFALFLPAWLVFAAMALAWGYQAEIRRFWREPVFKLPILIIESDDWGAGPLDQAVHLGRVESCLQQFRDREGQPPVMTLGVVLGIADGLGIERGHFSEYHRLDLMSPQFGPLVDAIRAGVSEGVFALQLHGMEHYWPPTLLAAGRQSAEIRAWIQHSPESWTEDLPSHLQSRWCDAAALPSTALSQGAVAEAAHAEVALFERVFGGPPRVAVPPTFVWNDHVEQAWAGAGVGVIVTPGRRFESRSASGAPALGGLRVIRNGDSNASGIHYVVRDVYFEPALGHRAESVPEQIARSVQLGRPTLLETHRFNFVRDEDIAQDALEEMKRALRLSLDRFPALRFFSTETLAAEMTAQNPRLIEQRLGKRIAVTLARLGAIGRLRKLATWTGIMLLAQGIYTALNRVYGDEVV